LINTISQDYYDVIEKKRLIVVQEESIVLSKKQFYQAKEFFKAGVKSKIDVTDAEVNYSTAQQDLIGAQLDYKLAVIQLEKDIGAIPNDGNYELALSDDNIHTLYNNISKDEMKLSEFKEKALKNRPELHALKLTIKGDEDSVKSAKGDYLPEIYAQGTYQENGDNGNNIIEDSASATINLKWNLFSGFDTDADVERLRSIKLQDDMNLQSSKLEIIQDVSQAVLSTQLYKATLTLNYKTVKLATQSLDEAQQRYKVGLGDYIEYNNAQVKYINAKTNFYVAYFNYKKSLADVEFSTANLLNKYDVTH